MRGSDSLGETPILFDKDINGFHFIISQSMVIQWGIIILFGIVAFFLTRNLKRIPGKRQTVLETIVVGINGIVVDQMGEKNRDLSSYVGALGFFLLIMNLTGLIGISPPTTDYNIALGLALTTFLMIQAVTIKRVGIFHYFIGYLKPMPFMLPMNILERVLLPVSLSLRLFGNMTAAAVIMEIIYKGLLGINFFAAIGVPILAHGYFDLFDGGVQMVVFAMLTMVNMKIISEH
jgi:F-type H+-transporting ATPase subunit a